MKAYYKTVLKGEGARTEYPFNDKPDDAYEYILLEMTTPCCEEMRNAMEETAIGFGEFNDTILNQDHNINFADCRPYPEGAVWDFYQIKFCPFCGEKVETEERERVTRKMVTKRVRHTMKNYEEVKVSIP